MWLSGVTMLLGIKFIFSTFAINLNTDDEHDLSVLSYNTRVFNVYDHLNKNYESSKKMINWVLQDDSDIKCLQEFYNKKQSKIFNTTERLRKNGAYHAYVDAKYEGKSREFGLAIFSRYPIIDKGRIEFKEESSNDAIYADIVKGTDTIRIINVHLQSISISEGLLEDNGLKKITRAVALKLKRGFIARAKQLHEVEKYIENCKYRVILCGDLNDLPYSYTYFKLQSMLHSSFENAGNGFGFSYNGTLFFLRIDNQFYSDGIEPIGYFTLREVSYSDHFPIKAYYKLLM